MRRRIVECVPNFSEGRDAAKVDRIAHAIASDPGVAVLGKTMDPDHNRSVITFAGAPEAVAEAAVRAVGVAAELIDLNGHTGVHPRIGATDVLPLVPVEGVTLADCVTLAHSVAAEIWGRYSIPVYLYEAAARAPERKRLEHVRRGQFEELRTAAVLDPHRAPDVGGPGLHPTAGATAVGARPFLIAYNVNLETADVAVAKRIAASIRASSGGLPNVKALGLPLAARGQTQVSINLTDFRATPLHLVYEAVRARALEEGVKIAGSEIIGLIPGAALENAAEHYLNLENFSPDLVLENRLAQALPYGVRDVLEQLSDPASTAGPQRGPALAGAMAAALGGSIARSVEKDPQTFLAHRDFFRAAAESGGHGPEQLTEELLQLAERAASLGRDLRHGFSEDPVEHPADLVTALGLADTAKSGALSAVEANLRSIENLAKHEAWELRARTLK